MSTSDSERVKASVARTVAAGTAHIRMRTDPHDGSPMSAEGTLDFDRRRSWSVLEMTLGSAGPGEPGDAVRVEAITDGPDLYVEAIERPGKWLMLPMSEDGTPMPSGDPGFLLDWLGGTRSAEVVGGAEVQGVPTTSLAVTVDLDRAVEAAPEGVRGSLRCWADAFMPEGGDARMTVWLDADERVRRVQVHSPEGFGDMQMELFGFGDDVVVRIPTSAEILTDADLAAVAGDEDLPTAPASEWDDPATPRP